MTIQQNASGFSTPTVRFSDQLITVRPRRLTFWVIFFVAFCFSGLLTVVGKLVGYPYRMGLISALVIPLILLYGIRISGVLLLYLVLTGVVLLSALHNNSSLMDAVLFMRILGFSYLAYKLVDLYVRTDNVAQVIRLCVTVAMFQLPVILLQRWGYNRLPSSVRESVSPIDFDFGTFNFKGDAPMAFFLVLIVIFSLFDTKRNYIIRHKWFVPFWLTLTILVTNAELVKLILMIVWGVYFFRYLNFKTLVYSVGALGVAVMALALSGALNEIVADFTYSLANNARIDVSSQEAFLSGNYARGAAIAYYIDKGTSWFGDGPSRYYDVFSKSRVLGNTGHILTFYSEIGLLGWLVSVLIFFMVAFPIRKGRIRLHWTSLLSFAAVQLLSATTQIMNDISVVLIYCIMAKSYLVKPRSLADKVGE